MFTDDHSIDNIRQLVIEFKKYLELQKDYTKLEATEKLSILLSTLALALLVIILGVVVLLLFSFALAYLLIPIAGGLAGGLALIGCFNVLLIALLVLFRKRLIINPTIRFIAGLLLDTPQTNHPHEQQ